jgi:hypothetical protein
MGVPFICKNLRLEVPNIIGYPARAPNGDVPMAMVMVIANHRWKPITISSSQSEYHLLSSAQAGYSRLWGTSSGLIWGDLTVPTVTKTAFVLSTAAFLYASVTLLDVVGTSSLVCKAPVFGRRLCNLNSHSRQIELKLTHFGTDKNQTDFGSQQKSPRIGSQF